MADTVYILLGSNLGDREKYLELALRRMSEIEGLEIIAASPIYLTEAQGMPDDNPAFMNQVIKAEYLYPPLELLTALETIETALGRTGKGEFLPRTIDLDILLFGGRKINTDRLTIPHKALLDRPFAMVPLLDIAPDLVHPITRNPIAEYLSAQGRRHIVLYKEHVTRNF